MMESIYLIKWFEVFKLIKESDINQSKKEAQHNNHFDSEVPICQTSNVWEMFNNNDNVRVKIEFKSLKEEIEENKILTHQCNIILIIL